MGRKPLGRKPLPEKKKLKHIVTTRLTEEKYRELKQITKYPPYYPISDLIRCILDNRGVKIFTNDPTIEPVMHELSVIREKIRLTGRFVNDHTKQFNSHQSPAEKEFFAKQAFGEYASLKPHIDRILEIVKEASKRWLTGEFSENALTDGKG